MPFINVFIENSCNINVLDNKLILKNQTKRAEYPIEDINCLLIDCLYNDISVYALHKLCESGATVFISDEKHLPSTIILPYNKYYKKLSVLNLQISLSKPKKRVYGKVLLNKKF